jgi:hypothetical protein
MRVFQQPVKQRGAASLLIALVLMMAITLVTLSVANTQLNEQRLSSSSGWHTRLAMQAKSGWHEAVVLLLDQYETLDWSTTPEGKLLHQRMHDHADQSIHTLTNLTRAPDTDWLVDVTTTAQRNDGSKLAANYHQWVRLLGVLTPAFESPPPLVINECPLSSPLGDIRPLHSDSDSAGTSIQLTGPDSCATLAGLDLHAGMLLHQPVDNPLWSEIFSISEESFATLAESDRGLPENQRRYWQVEPAELIANRWTRSLGSTSQPVALYFPPSLGCPQFADGVHIVGIVYMERAANCTQPLAVTRLQVSGSLIVSGPVDTGSAELQLNHIQNEDTRMTRLAFPALRAVPVPGTWRDF